MKKRAHAFVTLAVAGSLFVATPALTNVETVAEPASVTVYSTTAAGGALGQ